MARPDTSGRQLGLLWGGVAVTLVLASPLAPLLVCAVPACPFKALTGWPCPGCGTTRAALALAALDPVEAFSRYPLPALGWTVLIVGGLVAGGLALARRPLPSLPQRLPTWARVAAVATVAANWAWSIATGV